MGYRKQIDLKNSLVQKDKKIVTPKMDFGMAKARDLSTGAKVRSGKVLGTYFAQPNGWPLGPMNRFPIDWGATDLQILSDGMISTIDSFK